MHYQYKIALSFATEDQKLVEKVYHYLLAEGINVFFAPSREAQIILSGTNQREVFYNIFGLHAEYVALFVSKDYITKEVPLEEAQIAFAKHSSGSVIPIYIDGTSLPGNMFDPKAMNYFRSDNPAEIASHLASKLKMSAELSEKETNLETVQNVMHVSGNTAGKQIMIQTMNGSIEL